MPRHRLIATTLLAAFVGLVPPAARAQRVVPGDTVRLVTDSGVHLRGRILRRLADTLVIEPEGEEFDMPVRLASIARLEVRTGRTRNVPVGAAIGLLGGAVIGAAIARPSDAQTGCSGICGRELNALPYSVFGGMVGAVVGGMVGAIPRERWETVNLRGDATRVGIVRAGGGRLALAVSRSY